MGGFPLKSYLLVAGKGKYFLYDPYMRVVVKDLVKNRPLGIHFFKRGSEANREITVWPVGGQIF